MMLTQKINRRDFMLVAAGGAVVAANPSILTKALASTPTPLIAPPAAPLPLVTSFHPDYYPNAYGWLHQKTDTVLSSDIFTTLTQSNVTDLARTDIMRIFVETECTYGADPVDPDSLSQIIINYLQNRSDENAHTICAQLQPHLGTTEQRLNFIQRLSHIIDTNPKLSQSSQFPDLSPTRISLENITVRTNENFISNYNGYDKFPALINSQSHIALACFNHVHKTALLPHALMRLLNPDYAGLINKFYDSDLGLLARYDALRDKNKLPFMAQEIPQLTPAQTAHVKNFLNNVDRLCYGYYDSNRECYDGRKKEFILNDLLNTHFDGTDRDYKLIKHKPLTIKQVSKTTFRSIFRHIQIADGHFKMPEAISLDQLYVRPYFDAGQWPRQYNYITIEQVDAEIAAENALRINAEHRPVSTTQQQLPAPDIDTPRITLPTEPVIKGISKVVRRMVTRRLKEPVVAKLKQQFVDALNAPTTKQPLALPAPDDNVATTQPAPSLRT